MKKIFITYPIAPAGIERLKQHGYKIEMNEQHRLLSHNDFIAQFQNADAVITVISDKVDRTILDLAATAHTPTKIFANFGVGFNNIDVAYAKQLGIFVTNTPEVLTDATADTAFLLLLAVARRFNECQKVMQPQTFTGWNTVQNLGVNLSGKTLGIVGFGRIGEAMAKRAKAFDMNVIFSTRTEKTSEFATQVDFETLLRESDAVSIHTALTDETKHLFTKREFDKMKPQSILINTARGAVINEADLVSAIKAGKFFGVGLDVYEFEPLVSDDLYKLDNVILLPHIGAATIETRNKMSMLCAENIIAALDGKTPPNLVW
ncbi:MAG: hypothetical protein HY22_01165 [[Candidatus Thermochlorobacteriaceae] bacterium GBChlB]|nr:MAG: hypothetical protein HY22_01165 [[Candidatus Thermochlorobacteriaceae] bacterium GBChlB]